MMKTTQHDPGKFVHIGAAKTVTFAELVQRMAEHEKADIDALKIAANEREIERSKGTRAVQRTSQNQRKKLPRPSK